MANWRKPKLSALLWVAAAAWCCALFYFSGQSGAESSSLSLRFTRLVLRIFPALPWDEAALEPALRSLAHFGIFAVEGALLGAAMMTLLPERAVGGMLAAISCAIIAALNEYHQLFSPGRSCEFSDVLVDGAGGLVGVLFAALLLHLVFRALRRAAR